MLKSAFMLLLAFGVAAMPTVADASGGSNSGGGAGGGSGAGGGGKTATARITGLLTAIDYVNHSIAVGQLYYGTGVVKVNSSTKIQVNGQSVDFEDLQINDLAEVNYDYTTGVATKIAVTR